MLICIQNAGAGQVFVEQIQPFYSMRGGGGRGYGPSIVICQGEFEPMASYWCHVNDAMMHALNVTTPPWMCPNAMRCNGETKVLVYAYNMHIFLLLREEKTRGVRGKRK